MPQLRLSGIDMGLKYHTIYISTYTSPNGAGLQKLFEDKQAAEDWLRKQTDRDVAPKSCYEESYKAFNEWKKYGAWTAKVKKFKYVLDTDELVD